MTSSLCDLGSGDYHGKPDHVQNDVFPTFSAMPRRIAFLIFPDFQLLDTAGPVAVFESAGQLQPDAYELKVIAAMPGPVRSSSGVTMHAAAFGRADRIDTLVIAGGEGTRGALYCKRTQRFIQACAAKCRRVTSVCSGSYLLAQAGLLEG
jgi:transcriptional regulator GlxA family with amidase domain